MPTLNTLFPSKYLRGIDLEQPLQLRVKHVSVEKVGPEREDKPICYFVGDTKPMVLNKTNCTALINITGSDDSDDWGGARVEVYRETILMHGESMPCLRLRAIRTDTDDVPTEWGDEPPLTAGKKKKVA